MARTAILIGLEVPNWFTGGSHAVVAVHALLADHLGTVMVKGTVGKIRRVGRIGWSACWRAQMANTAILRGRHVVLRLARGRHAVVAGHTGVFTIVHTARIQSCMIETCSEITTCMVTIPTQVRGGRVRRPFNLRTWCGWITVGIRLMAIEAGLRLDRRVLVIHVPDGVRETEVYLAMTGAAIQARRIGRGMRG